METNYKGNANKSGVYRIINRKTGRIYIGSAKIFKSRYYQHIGSLRKGTHHNKFLQNDFNKCSSEDFLFEVIEVVNGSTIERRNKEQIHLNENFLLGPNICYNNAKKTVVVDFVKKRGPLSEEVKQKLSNSLKGRKVWNKGVYGYSMPPCSQEKKDKITKAHKGKIIPREIVEKARLARGDYSGAASSNTKVFTNLCLVSPDGILYTQIDCLVVFCQEHNLHYKCMWKVLNRLTASHRKWKLLDYVHKSKIAASIL